MKKILLKIILFVIALFSAKWSIAQPIPPRDSAESYFEQARAFYNKKQYSEALAPINSALSANPNYGDAYALRGQAYAKLGKYNAAKTDLNTALQEGVFKRKPVEDLLNLLPDEAEVDWEVVWQAPEPDKIQINHDKYTIKACVKGKAVTEQSVQLYIDADTLSFVNRGLKTVRLDCKVEIELLVSLKQGANHFYIVHQGQKSSVKTIIFNPPPLYKPRLALVIGNNQYQIKKWRLDEVPLRDAEMIRDSLRQCGFEVGFHTDLNKADLDAVLNQFITALNKQSFEAALFYFAGHGLQIGEHGFIVPTDAIPQTSEDVKQQCISLDKLKESMITQRAELSIIITDACREDPFAELKKRMLGKSFSFGMSEKAFELPKNDYFLAYAAGDGQTISNKGWFTQQWVKHMMIRIGIREVMDRTQAAVIEIAQKAHLSQRPYSIQNMKKEFFFKK
jgi:tetratricopeptide (TPR) repeat protein